jgi:hypothetical protein
MADGQDEGVIRKRFEIQLSRPGPVFSNDCDQDDNEGQEADKIDAELIARSNEGRQNSFQTEKSEGEREHQKKPVFGLGPEFPKKETGDNSRRKTYSEEKWL